MKVATFNANSIRSRLPILCGLQGCISLMWWVFKRQKFRMKIFLVKAFSDLGYYVTFCGEKSYNGVAFISKAPAADVYFGFNDGGPVDATRLIRLVGEVEINTYIPQGRAIDHVMYRLN